MAERRVQARREAIAGIATGVVLGIGLIYLVGVNYVGGWKVAPDRCSSSAVSEFDGIEANSDKVEGYLQSLLR
jgi:hypothetical protein